MNRSILHLLLITALLACPMRCYAHSAISSDSGTASTVGCGCCSSGEAPSDALQESSDLPEKRKSDCECQSCICKGAITQSEVDVLAALNAEFFIVDAINRCLSKSLGKGSRRGTVSIDDSVDERFLSGRQVRIARQSLLI